ncbi:MAG TPA: hypothetical protein VH593_17795 [Ktedonobacteraceae bacterium]
MEYLQLEIELILLHLKENRASGSLQADLPERFMLAAFSQRAPGKAQLTLQAGEVVSGFIATPQAVLLQHKQQILRVLAQAGVLSWQLILAATPQELPSAQTNPRLPALPVTDSLLRFSSIPYRTHQIGLEFFSDLMARRVYQLIDGQRSIERIALLAHVTPEYAISLIQYLREQGFVSLVR